MMIFPFWIARVISRVHLPTPALWELVVGHSGRAR